MLYNIIITPKQNKNFFFESEEILVYSNSFKNACRKIIKQKHLEEYFEKDLIDFNTKKKSFSKYLLNKYRLEIENHFKDIK